MAPVTGGAHWGACKDFGTIHGWIVVCNATEPSPAIDEYSPVSAATLIFLSKYLALQARYRHKFEAILIIF